MDFIASSYFQVNIKMMTVMIQSTLSKADIRGISCKCPPCRELMWRDSQNLWHDIWIAIFIRSKIKRSQSPYMILCTLERHELGSQLAGEMHYEQESNRK